MQSCFTMTLLSRTTLGAIIISMMVLCASSPVSALESPGVSISRNGTTAGIKWTSVTGATGYRLVYASTANPDERHTADMGNTTEFSAVLPVGASYYVAIIAYNATEESAITSENIQTLSIPETATADVEVTVTAVSCTQPDNNGGTAIQNGLPVSLEVTLNATKALDSLTIYFYLEDSTGPVDFAPMVISDIRQGTYSYQQTVSLTTPKSVTGTFTLQAKLDPFGQLNGTSVFDSAMAPVTIDLANTYANTLDLVMEEFTLDSYMVELKDESTEALSVGTSTEDVNIRDAHIQATVVIVSRGSDATNVPVKFKLEMPDNTQKDLLVWDSNAKGYADSLTIATMKEDIPVSIAVGLLIPTDVAALFPTYFQNNQHLFAVGAKINPDATITETDLSITSSPEMGDLVEVDNNYLIEEVVILPEQGLRKHSIHFSEYFEKNWSNNYFGATCKAGGEAQFTSTSFPAAIYIPNVGTVTKVTYMTGEALAKLDTKIVGSNKNFAEINAKASMWDYHSDRIIAFTTEGGTLNASIKFLGNTIYSKYKTLNNTYTYEPSYSKSVSAHTTVTVGLIPVTFTAGVSGTLSMEISATLNGITNITLTGTPKVSSQATASASVGGDVGFASAHAGVEGTLTLLSIGVPASVSATISPASGSNTWTIDLSETINSNVSGMNGSVGLFAEAYVLGIGKRWEKSLASWNGYTNNQRLFSSNQSETFTSY